MPQDITLLGATYSAVPGVQLPKQGGGTALFTDVTPTTASAADVAQGKIFFDASGSQQTGTASGGGGGSPKKFVMRPDAELVQRHSADYLAVADEGLTLPSYSTSSQTVVASTNLSPTILTDSHHDYFITMRGLAIPQYNTTTKQKGRCDYTVSSYLYELVIIPANDAHSIDGTKSYATNNPVIVNHSYTGRAYYWTSATAFGMNGSASYGANVTGVAPTINNSMVLTIKSPTCGIRGSTSYMTSGAWSTMTDIRYQWIVEVWKAPNSEVAGWEHTSAIRSMLADVRNGGDLT